MLCFFTSDLFFRDDVNVCGAHPEKNQTAFIITCVSPMLPSYTTIIRNLLEHTLF
jgi:hypothetical protein